MLYIMDNARNFTYRKLISRRGDHFIVMDLKAYADACLSQNLGKSLPKDDWMICPYCSGEAWKTDPSYHGKPYTKFKLSVSKDRKYGKCFRCNNRFVNEDYYIHFDFDIPEPPVSMSDFDLVKLNDHKWNLSKFDTFSTYDEQGLNYLIKKRHYHMRDLYKMLNIRFDENHNPVIPFYFHGELIYYQIKNAFNTFGPPYFSPPISHKPAYIIEHGDNKKFVISEGTFDGIADLLLYPDRTPFCILGSSITDYQITMLRTYAPEDILVYLDETGLSEKVADKISRFIDYADIHIQKSYGQDPEEKLKSLIALNSELV